MMGNLCRNRVLLFLLLLLVAVLQFQIAVQQEGGAGHRAVQEEPQYPLFHKYVLDTVSLLKKSHKSSWEKVKTVIHDFQMRFSPPNVDFRGATEDQSEGIKEAAEKSFQKSTQTVKESAKSAAEMVGEAVHQTAQKVKAPPSSASASERESDSEL